MDKFVKVIVGIIISIIVVVSIWFINFKDSGMDTFKYDELVVNESIEDISFDTKPNVYFFWGDGCGHCENLKEFINDLPLEYKELFTFNSFEIWYNDDNKELMIEIGEHFEEEVNSIPYLVIGDKTFSGYAPIYDEEIMSAIEMLDENIYDVYKEIK